MEINRTPDSCFEALADYPFAPNYVEVDDFEGGMLRMHYVDEGPKDGPLVVMVHGNPTWSYMWRKLIPMLVDNGYRAIAIDLIGAGRSDKPTKMKDYTIARHEAWVKQALFEEIGVKDAHFILHDWGGIIGKVTLTYMPQADIESYAAPYPDKSYLTGIRQFTQMLPARNNNPMLTENWQALQKLKKFEKPFLNLFSDKDKIAPKGYKSVRPTIPGTRDYEPIILKGGSHFLVEDIPQDYAREVIKFYEGLAI